MTDFNYRCLDRDGREVRGRVTAANEGMASLKLKDLGFFPTELKRIKGKINKEIVFHELPLIRNLYSLVTKGKIKDKTLTAFTRQLATLLKAGLPLVRSLETLKKQTKSTNLKKALEEVVEDIESGSNFSESLSRQPAIFNQLYISMIRAGEVSGSLEALLRRLALFGEKRAVIKTKIKSALAYPLVVMGLATTIVTLILIFVVPKFEDIYNQLGRNCQL